MSEKPTIDCRILVLKRKALGLTQAQVAESLGLTQGFISQIERGSRKRLDTQLRYAKLLNLQMNDLATDKMTALRISIAAGAEKMTVGELRCIDDIIKLLTQNR